MIETNQAPLDVQRLVQLGAEGFGVLKILTGEQGVVTAGRIVDWNLALDIAGQVDASALSRGATLSAEKRTRIVKHLHLRFAAQGQVDAAALDETMRMSV